MQQTSYICMCPGQYQSPLPAGPSLPEDLSVILQSSNSIKVQWTEPAIDGGDASINYTIVLQGSPGAMTRTETSTSTTFTGLVPPNTYTVQVTAVNSAGSSAPANGTIAFQGKCMAVYAP